MPGLNKIVLHNSYFAGKTVAIPCNGNTNNSGENGAGKTSALNLIPIFYGEEPERLNVRSAGKKSFVDFYLPTRSSLIAFEYTRDDGDRCAIMYRHTSGGIAYRFIKAGLEDSFFKDSIRQRMLNGMPVLDVINELKQSSIEVSGQITNVMDYRSVIQQDSKLLRRGGRGRANYRGVAREYCLGNAETKMSHMDRLTHAVLKRSNMFGRLKNMIAETQFEDVVIGDKPAHLKNKTLINDISSVREFADKEPEFRECIRVFYERKAVKESLFSTARTLVEKISSVEDEIKAQSRKRDQINQRHEHNKTVFEDEQRERSNQISATEGGIRDVNKKIEDAYTCKSDWEAQDIVNKQEEFASLDTYRSQYDQAKVHWDTMKCQIDNIQLERDQAINEARDKHRISQLAIDKKKNKVRDERERALQTSAETTSLIQTTLQVALDQHHNESNNESIGLASKLERLKTEARLISMNEEERLKEEAASNHIENIENAVGFAEHKLDDHSILANDLKKQQDDGLHELGLARQRINLSIDRCEKVTLQLYPQDGTLLAELRQQDPGWVHSLGKVLRPELLERKDLSPDLQNDDNTIYGWALDVDKIELPEHAQSEEYLRATLDNEEAIQRVAKQAVEDEERKAEQVKQSVDDAGKKHNQLEHVLRQLKVDLNAVREDKRLVSRKIKDAIAERRARAKEAASATQKSLDQYKKDMLERSKEIAQNHQQQIMDEKGRYSILSNDFNEALMVQRGVLKGLENRLAEQLKQIENHFTEHCKQEGANPELVSCAREDYAALRKKISQIEGYASNIESYKAWKRQEWDLVSSREVDLQKKKSGLGELNSVFMLQKQTYEEQRNAYNHEKRELEREHKELTEQVDNARFASNSVRGLPPGDSGETGNLSVLTNRLNDLQRQNGELRQNILIGVKKASNIIMKFAQSQIRDAWERELEARCSRCAYEEHDAEFQLQQPQDLEMLLDNHIPQIRQTLVETVRSVGGSVNNYYISLKRLTTQVSKVSSKLATKINTGQTIDSLSEIEIVLTSRIEEDECWKPLIAFNVEWDLWNINRGATLPPESLINALKLAIDTLTEARISKNKETLIDMHLSMRENNEYRVVRSDLDFNNLSSNGLSYLAICIVFMGMCRYLCPDKNVQLTWPVDELASLSPKNIAKLFAMMEKENIVMFSAFPSTDPSLLKFFENCNMLDMTHGVRVVNMDMDGPKSMIKSKLLADIAGLDTEEKEGGDNES